MFKKTRAVVFGISKTKFYSCDFCTDHYDQPTIESRLRIDFVSLASVLVLLLRWQRKVFSRYVAGFWHRVEIRSRFCFASRFRSVFGGSLGDRR